MVTYTNIYMVTYTNIYMIVDLNRGMPEEQREVVCRS
jgi:hypothetical protein